MPKEPGDPFNASEENLPDDLDSVTRALESDPREEREEIEKATEKETAKEKYDRRMNTLHEKVLEFAEEIGMYREAQITARDILDSMGRQLVEESLESPINSEKSDAELKASRILQAAEKKLQEIESDYRKDLKQEADQKGSSDIKSIEEI